MGRDRKNEGRSEHFTKLVRNMMESAAWRALPPVAQALYPWLRLEWRGPDHNNNGSIRLSVRQAAERLGVSRNTAAKAFHQLQAKGFITVTVPAKLGLSGVASPPQLELTELPLPKVQSNEGRRLYKEWKPGAEFSIMKAAVHNPKGNRTHSKTRHQNGDEAVIEIETRRKAPSQF